jgi:antirestriction protein ArdC
MTKKDIYEVVVDTIVEALENAKVGKWKCPWDMSQGSPVNGLTGRPYSGVNVLLLTIMRSIKGYSSSEWVTYKQAIQFGERFDSIGEHKDGSPMYPHIRKGEESTQVVFWRFIDEYKDSKGNVVAKPKPADIKSGKVKKVKSIPMLRTYNVFNVDQMEGPFLKDGQPVAKPEEQEKQRLEDADAFILSTGASIKHGGNVACYIPSQDIIKMPRLSDFHETPSYYATAFHELGHWTGHRDRLNRNFAGSRFDTEAYAVEELVAELTAAFLCGDFRIEGNLQHPEYISSWIKVLKDDKHAIFTASREAMKAAKLLHNIVEEIEEVA